MIDPKEAKRLGSIKGGQMAAISKPEYAREFYEPLIPIVAELHAQGLSLRKIAAELEKRGVQSPQGWKTWSASQVRRIVQRIPAASAAEPASEPKPVSMANVMPTPAPAKSGQAAETPAAPVPATPPVRESNAANITLWLPRGNSVPHSIAEVRAIIAAGTATLETLCRVNSGPWKQLRSLLGA